MLGKTKGMCFCARLAEIRVGSDDPCARHHGNRTAMQESKDQSIDWGAHRSLPTAPAHRVRLVVALTKAGGTLADNLQIAPRSD